MFVGNGEYLMKIKITKISGQNFGGLEKFSFDFYNRTKISGSNSVGKTTLMNAFFWVLLDKTADGTSAGSMFRPHDENGTDTDFVDIIVEVTFDIDGKEVCAKKTQKQSWVKDRTTQESRFKGNVNEYTINDIPKKEKDFKEYFDKFVSLDDLVFCSNPKAFLRLDSKKRREKLMGMVGEFTNDEIISTNEKFSFMRNDLMDGTIDELISRSKKAISSLKDSLKTLPVRIDEASANKQEISEAEVQKLKSDYEQKKVEAQGHINDLKKASENLQIMKDEKLKLSFMLSDMVNKKNAIASDQKNKLFWEKEKATEKYYSTNRDLNDACQKCKDLKSHIEEKEIELAELQKKVEEEKTKKADFETKCPTCGAEYGKDKIKQFMEDFEKSRVDAVSRLEENVSEIQKTLLLENDNLLNLTDYLINVKKNVSDCEREMETARKAYESFNPEDSIVESQEYKDIQKKIAELDSKISVIPDLKADIKDWEERLSEIECTEKQKAINAQSALDLNRTLDQRISDLKSEIKFESQKLVDEQKKLDIYEEFSRAKVQLLTDKVNGFFRLIQWQMFKQNINGGYESVCNPLVNGTNYDTLLNHGNKILAEIDICQAFQKSCGVDTPIFIDDTESLDEWRVPVVECQLISLRRTDDKKLLVSEME